MQVSTVTKSIDTSLFSILGLMPHLPALSYLNDSSPPRYFVHALFSLSLSLPHPSTFTPSSTALSSSASSYSSEQTARWSNVARCVCALASSLLSSPFPGILGRFPSASLHHPTPSPTASGHIHCLTSRYVLHSALPAPAQEAVCAPLSWAILPLCTHMASLETSQKDCSERE